MTFQATQTHPQAHVQPSSPALALTQVSKTYGDGDGLITALHPTSLRVQPGELVAVNGPSGSG